VANNRHARHSAPRVLTLESARRVRRGYTVHSVLRVVPVAVMGGVIPTRGHVMAVYVDHMEPSVSRRVQQDAPILVVIRTEHATNVSIQTCMVYTATVRAAVYV